MALDNENVKASDVTMEKDKKLKEEKYNAYVKQKTPTANIPKNVFSAFLVGGSICALGQFFMNMYMNFGVDKELAASYTTLSLILLSVLATGFNLYSKLTRFAGAGSVVPITGFANSVAACAIEYKKEGQEFGIGCQIFNIAGPVILSGTLSSWILGVIYYILKSIGVV